MTDNNIIPVNKLKERVSSRKSNRSKRYNRLQSMLENRKKKRETWDEEKRSNYEKFLVRLKSAHDNYVDALKNKISECAESILERNINAKTFKLWDPQNIECDMKNFSEFTIYRGFWNAEKKKHDRLPHMEAGITAIPLKQVMRELQPLGYKIEDISDLSKSTHVVIEVTLLSKEKVDADDAEVDVSVTNEDDQSV